MSFYRFTGDLHTCYFTIQRNQSSFYTRYYCYPVGEILLTGFPFSLLQGTFLLYSTHKPRVRDTLTNRRKQCDLDVYMLTGRKGGNLSLGYLHVYVKTVFCVHFPQILTKVKVFGLYWFHRCLPADLCFGRTSVFPYVACCLHLFVNDILVLLTASVELHLTSFGLDPFGGDIPGRLPSVFALF